MAWCIDANIFIESARTRFPADIFPVFWTSLHAALGAGHCIAIDEVKKELVRGHDDLSTWAKSASFLPNDDEATTAALAEILGAVEQRAPAYLPHAKTTFQACADPWVIAYCKAHHHTLVTHEVSAPLGFKSVKIPDIAHAVGVTVVDLNGMLRALSIKFQ